MSPSLRLPTPPPQARAATPLVLALLFLLPPISRANEIGFLEDFALAENREEVLAKLIPGTEEYYYFHCLHEQNSGRLDAVQEILKPWIERHGRTPRVVEIESRQALLRYDTDPHASLDYLRRELDLRFDHQRDSLDDRPDLPRALDPDLVSRETLSELALQRHPRTLDGFETRALDWVIDTPLSPERRRQLLERLEYPDHENLPRLIVDDLNAKESRGFGSLPIHGRLLRSQLDACLELKPDLLQNTGFVTSYLKQLWPDPDVEWRVDASAREAYLERLESFVSRLGPAFNSLKAHVLYHRLAHDRSRGVHDRDRFLRYLRLPRRAAYARPGYLEEAGRSRFPADLSSDFREVTQFPPVGDDEPLVRGYLQHFFRDEASYEAYADLVREEYLRSLFAETKILAGVGDQETWASMLSPAEYRALRERVDLDFAPGSPTHFSPQDQVALDLDVKNVESLIVKVFEINTFNYYRSRMSEIDTAIDLDGLVAGDEQTFSYTESPLRRVRRHFEFPGLRGRGVYVIEFIGNGKSSRALIHKGQLRFLVQDSPAGQLFTILDEANRKLPQARLWLGGHTYLASDDGVIHVPYSSQPGRRPIILLHGGFATLDFFQHAPERYHLYAGFHVERESLVRRQESEVLVRPSLTVNRTPISLSLLEDVRLVITSTDLDGVSTTREIADFALHEDRESVQQFQVPPRLASLQFTLQARVENLGEGKKQELAVSRSFHLNGIDRSEQLEDLHLGRLPGGHFIDLLGKTGEFRPNRPVRLTLKHRDFRDAVSVNLQTDGEGRIRLGSLDGIEWVEARGPEGTTHRWHPGEDAHSLPAQLHGRAGETVSVPYMGSATRPERSEFALLQRHGKTYVRDRFEALALEDGFLLLRDLDAGDYELVIKSPRRRSITVRLTDGERSGGHVLSRYRLLEERNARPLQITAVDRTDDSVRIHLKNASPFSRVHVAATRYLPEYPLYPDVDAVPYPEPSRVLVPSPASLYVVGRDIGDEYRYVLERKLARKFPGNMLERPSLLLNPWDIETTQTTLQTAAEGGMYDARGGSEPSRRAGARARGEEEPGPSGEGFSSFDFLGRPAAVLTNLRADARGVVTIARTELGGGQHLHIVAVDPQNTVYRQVALEEAEPAFDDLRLSSGLDPSKHYTEQKERSLVEKGSAFRVKDVTTSEIEVYDSLRKIHSLYLTLTGDPRLVEFSFILDWPKLDDEKKRELYSRHACHELHFFLHRRDPEFFEAVVRPYLRNKYQKTFLDHWLLGDELGGYLDARSYARLNVVEKILLATRIEGERARTARHIDDLAELIPPDLDRLNFLFTTALQGRSLESAGALGLERTIREARKEAEPDAKIALAELDASGAEDAEAGRPAKPGSGKPTERDANAVEELPPLVDASREAGLGKAAAGIEDLNGFWAANKRQRGELRKLYRRLETTREWVENNYYRLPIERQDGSLVPVNPFWRDFARHEEGPFVSTHFPEASSTFSEMMFALAVLDLPFEAGEHETVVEGGGLELKAATPLVVFHREIREAGAGEKSPILVSQNFFRHGDRYRQVGGERVEKYVEGEFLAHTAYGCHVVITNPGSSRQKLNVLLQIPRGSIPVLGGEYTRSVRLVLEPYRTWTQDYSFYFPAAGDFVHYPVQVARNEKIVAFAAAPTLHVVERPSRLDRESWEFVSQRGSDEELIEFLRTRNLEEVDLARIAWRMRQAGLFSRVLDLLRGRHVYDGTLWSYGIRHDDRRAIREYLHHADRFLDRLGGPIDSTLLRLDPVERRSYQHREYWPLVNARAHRLGKRRQILNDRFYAQYMQYLKLLSYLGEPGDNELLAVTYYLLLQDRVEEALSFFSRVRPGHIEARLQYDYLASQLGFYTENTRRSREIASKYEDFPVARWRERFENVLAQVAEIEGEQAVSIAADDGSEEGRAIKQTKLADAEARLDFEVEGQTVTLRHANVDRCRVSFYPMDIELLFSRRPFVQEYADPFAFIRPKLTLDLDLDPAEKERVFEIPEPFRSANVLIEVSGGGATKSLTHFSNALAVQLTENYAQLKVTQEETHRPLAGVYVKVFARMRGGSVRFYKDGYTDLRGRFDYGSLSTDELGQVERFSLLILSEEHGALVREAPPPQM